MYQPTERTLLTRAREQNGYVGFARVLRTRRNKMKQFQCCVCATFIATFIMALVVTISYSASHLDSLPLETNISHIDEAQEISMNQLNLLGRVHLSLSEFPKKNITIALNKKELEAAVEAGDEAIAARRLADSLATPLPLLSPSSRHQYAMSTNYRANQLALVGVAEIAATKKIESSRSFMGKPTSFGSVLNIGWMSEKVCKDELNIECPLYAAKYRTFDGSCNHPLHLGKAFTSYGRSLPADYADGIEAPRIGKFGNALPSARVVSLEVHPPSPSTNPSFTVMLAVFGQFLDHDITATAISQGTNGNSLSCCSPSGNHPECFPVKVGLGDSVYDVAGNSCMEFVRSAPAAQCKIGPRQQLNQVTAFIDGSTVYGSDLDTAKSLREFSSGRLRMQITPDKRLLLPASINKNDGCNRDIELARGRYCFATGDARANENLHLTTMHLLWARQHNLLANQLKKINPQWNDEKIYQESRRIVGAQLQHITYNEFISIVLGESETSRRSLKPLRKGFKTINNSDADPTISNYFSAAAFRFAHTLLPGLMKVTDKQRGTFSYIQLHKILFNPYSLYSEGGVENSVTTAMSNVIQKTSTHVTSQLTKHLFEDPMANQKLPCGLDLVSLNIQRGRDHGLPGYTKWREYCGLGRISEFEDLKGHMDVKALDAISKLYDNVDDVDLYTGALAELTKEDGLVGPTFKCLIADQFEKLQLGDRYWYEIDKGPGSFNEDQLNELRKTTLARIICDTSDNITEIQAQVMRSEGPDNPIISCEDIPHLSLGAWKMEIPLLTELETEVPNKYWLNFKTEVNKTLGDIIRKIMEKKPPSKSMENDWLNFEKNINMTFTDLKKKLTSLHPKIIIDVSLARNITNKLDEFYRFIINNEINDTILDIMDSIVDSKFLPKTVLKERLTFRNINNDSLLDIQMSGIFANIKNKYANHYNKNINTTIVKLSQIMKDSTFDIACFTKYINKLFIDLVSLIKSNQFNSSIVDWVIYKNDVKVTINKIKNQIDRFKMKELFESDYVECFLKSDPSFDWTGWKSQINKTTDEVFDYIKSILPVDPKWMSFRDYLIQSFLDIKNNVLRLQKNSEQTNLMKIMNEDLLNFKNQIYTIIEQIHNDTIINKLVRKAFSKENYNVYNKNKFAQIHENFKSIKADWLKKLKSATEMMIVTDSQLSTNNSAFCLKDEILGTNLCMSIAVTFITFRFVYLLEL